jgi:hypothetical protein
VVGCAPPTAAAAVRRRTCKDLPEGGVSDVVRSGAGFHIVKVVEKRQPACRHDRDAKPCAPHPAAATPQLTEAQARAEAGRLQAPHRGRPGRLRPAGRENSQDASARNGGDLGWASPGMFVPEFEEVLNGLRPGQIADPVVSRFGVHLIQLLERRQATLSQREQREVARNLVREKKLDEAYVQWAQEVRGRAYVEYREPPRRRTQLKAHRAQALRPALPGRRRRDRRDRARDRSARRPADGGDRPRPGGADAAAGGAPRPLTVIELDRDLAARLRSIRS